MAPTPFYSTVAAGVKPFLRASVNAARGHLRGGAAKVWNAIIYADAFARAFGDLIAVPLGFGSTKPAANCWERGESPGAATGFAKHQLEGPSNKPLGSGL